MTMTTNQPAVIDEGAFSVRRSIRIAADQAKVWATITQPDLISQWFGRADFDGTAEGAVGTLTWDGRGSLPVRIEAIDEPHSISYRWNNDDASGLIPDALDEPTSTVFIFTLEPVDGATLLTVVETGFENTSDPVANLGYHRSGWTSELDKLVALLEGTA